MNPTFDFGRWGLLVGQHWIENKKRYLLSIAAMAGILFMWFFFVTITDETYPMNANVQRGTYFFLLFVTGCFYASQFYRELGSRSRAINYLLTPASSLEKLLVSLLYAAVLFFIVYTAIFYVVDAIMVMLVNMFHPSYTEANANGALYKTSVTNVFGRVGRVNGTPFFFAAYFSVQAAFLLGSVYYEKYSFVKTVISLFVVLLAIWLVNSFLLEAIMPEGSYLRDIGSFRILNTKAGTDYLVELPVGVRDTISALVKWGFPFFFWVVTYFRLKEKEV
jgi:hypothetical protein